MDPRSQMDDRLHAIQRMPRLFIRRLIMQHDPFMVQTVRTTCRRDLGPVTNGRSHRKTFFPEPSAQGRSDEPRRTGDKNEVGHKSGPIGSHLTKNSMTLAGYLEKIFTQFVSMPFSRQARNTSLLSTIVLRHPPVLIPPTRMRTSVSGRLR